MCVAMKHFDVHVNEIHVKINTLSLVTTWLNTRRSKILENFFDKSFYVEFLRAPDLAREYETFKIRILIDVEQIYILNYCDWSKIEENRSLL